MTRWIAIAALCAVPASAGADAKAAGKNGRIGGKPFTAVSAVMRTNPADGIEESKIIDVYAVKVTCDKPFEGNPGDAYLDVAITVKGKSAKAEGDYLRFTTLDKTGGPDGRSAQSGSVELAGKTLKMDAKLDADNFVTGKVSVIECK